jgi:hypothetical protein
MVLDEEDVFEVDEVLIVVLIEDILPDLEVEFDDTDENEVYVEFPETTRSGVAVAVAPSLSVTRFSGSVLTGTDALAPDAVESDTALLSIPKK